MSANCPPQLHLTLPANTFKRSFEQFGFDLESPGGAEPGSSNAENGSRNRTSGGNERRKRARSASSLSDGHASLRSSRSSTFTASSDTTSLSEDNEPIAGPSSGHPPRLPTPDIPDIQDIEMPGINSNEYRLSFQDLVGSRSPASPPTLPPLALSEEEHLHSSADSTEDFLITRTLDAPPRLPSPVIDSSPTLSAAIPTSDPSIIDLNQDTATEAQPSDQYISFRDRLNTAVEILEADDVSTFRETLTSALDAVRTESRDEATGTSRQNSAPADAGSRSWRSSVLNNTRNDNGNSGNHSPRIRDLFGPASSSRPPNTESRGSRPSYQLSIALLGPNRSSPSPTEDITDILGATDERRNPPFLPRFTSTERRTLPRRPSPQLTDDLLLPSRLPSTNRYPATTPSPFTRELARWFEDPADSASSSVTFQPSDRLTPDMNDDDSDSDSDWATLMGQSLATSNRINRGRARPLPELNHSAMPTYSFAASNRPEDNYDQDQEDEDVIARLLAYQERFESESPTILRGTTIGTSSRARRPLPSPVIPSRVRLPRLHLPSRDATDEDAIMEPADSNSTEPARDSPIPRRYTDVLSISDYRASQLLADSRRRYMEQGLLDPGEHVDGMNLRPSSNAGERRRGHHAHENTSVPDLSEPSASVSGYRLSAYPEPRSSSPAVRWQFSWTDALGSSEQTDLSDDDDDEDNTIRRELLDHRERLQRLRFAPRSSLFGRNRTETSFSGSRAQLPELPHSTRWSQRRSEAATAVSSTIDDPTHRLRSRGFATTRPSASNSLVAENAAEIRRRGARADLMEHLFNETPTHDHARPSTRDHHHHPRASDASRSTPTDTFYPSLPPLPYQHHRSPSPPDFPRSIAEVAEAADRETEAQERFSREEEYDFPSRRSTNLSWLPPPQFGSLDINVRNSEGGGRDDSIPSMDWLRRRSSALGRPRYSDESETRSRNDSDGQTRPARSHVHSSSWSSSRSHPQLSETSGFFDSRQSSISDMARTITNNERQTSFIYSPLRDSVAAPSDTSNVRQPVPAYPSFREGERRLPPFLPPSDFGALFSPNELPTSPFDLTYAPNPDLNLPSRLDANEDMSRSRIRPAAANRHPESPRASVSRPLPYVNNDIPAGPFGGTMRRFLDQNRMRQEPPSIPPLTFEDEDFIPTSRSFTRSRGDEGLDSPNAHTSSSASTRESYPFPPPLLRARARESSRPGEDIHEAITRRVRMGVPVLEGAVPSSSGSTPTTALGDRSFNHAIEVLRQDRPDARSNQLMDRYQRQRRDNVGANTSWGDITSNDNSNSSYRWAAWGGRGNSGPSNPTASSSVTDTSTRMGNAAARRRASPNRGSERPDRSQPGPSRPRIPSRYGRHRTTDQSLAEREFLGVGDIIARSRRARGSLNLGDFMRDEDFDQSYEGLMSLAATLGEVKPRATPDHVVAGLKAGFYREWASEDSDKRCPICLDDYKALDPVLKLNDCPHWLHKSCLEQWLKGACTCPVCRHPVQAQAPHRHPRIRGFTRRSFPSPGRAGPSQSNDLTSDGIFVTAVDSVPSTESSNNNNNATPNPPSSNASSSYVDLSRTDNNSDGANRNYRDALRSMDFRSHLWDPDSWEYHPPPR